MTIRDEEHRAVRQWLSQPATYAEGGPVEIRETHISMVFLTPRHAWKLLKPVRFDFLDFSTPAARCAECRNEVRLNRRLARGVYLAVLPVVQTAHGLQWGRTPPTGEKQSDQQSEQQTEQQTAGGDHPAGGRVVDWVIQMRRLSDADTLRSRIEGGKASAEDLDCVLEVLIPFFQSAPHNAAIARDGDVSVVRRNLTENLETLSSHSAELTAAVEPTAAGEEGDGATGDATNGEATNGEEINRGKTTTGDANEERAKPFDGLFAALRNLQLQFTAVAAEVFHRRVEEGWIRDGHGDLRAEHIYLEQPPVIVDCIAFNDRFRHVDVLDEICFLATDLVNLGRDDLAEELIVRYRRRMNDPAPAALAAFFQSYRFTVRAKVACLRSEEQEEPERSASLCTARQLMRRGYAVLRPFHQPWVIVFCGVSGSGKSTVARLVAEETGAVHLASDKIRKELFGIDPHDHSAGAELYTPAANRRTYAALLRQAAEYLRCGATVLLDATFRHPGERQRAEELAVRCGASFLLVEFRVSRAVAEERIRRRQAAGEDISDADIAVLRSQWEHFQPPAEISPARRLVVPAEWGPAETGRQIVSRLSVVYPSANN